MKQETISGSFRSLARRLGLDWNYARPRDVFNEMRKAMPSIAGITWERLEAESSVTYPCEKEGDPGQPVVFVDRFPTATGRAQLVPADIIPAAEKPDREFPFVLITGRPARALAHRRHHAPRERAGCART